MRELPELSVEPAESQSRESVRRRVLIAADVVALALAYVSVWIVVAPDAALSERLVLAGAVPLWILLNKLLGLYDRDAHLIHKSTLDELPRLALSAILGATLVFMLAPPVAGFELGRVQTVSFMAFALVWVSLLRGLGRTAIVRRLPPERCLIVGSGFVGGMVERKLAMHPENGVEVVGFVDVPFEEDDADRGQNALASPPTRALLGDLDRFDEICSEFRVDRVVVAFSSISHERMIDVIGTSKRLGLKVSVVPRLFEVIGHSVEIDQIEGITMLGLRGFSRPRSSLALKRAIDVGGAAAGLVLLTPLMLAAALAIKLTSPGPVFFAQPRVGGGTRQFSMLKFRTMVEGADHLKADLAHLNEAVEPMFKIADDPRITKVGRFLRRTSLDELPQLFNVLRGDMSLVGPRPLVPSEDVHVIGRHRERLDLTPGLTGPWQVLGRTAIPFAEMIRLDYLYVAEWSQWNDVKLMLRTAPAIFQARGH